MQKKLTSFSFFVLFFCVFFNAENLLAQTYPLTTIYPWTTKERRKGTYYDMTSWDSSPYKEFSYVKRVGPMYWDVTEYMNFRLLFPKDYDSTANDGKIYPMIVMLHGAGESGIEWSGHNVWTPSDPEYDNNDLQLKWGGQEHLAARNRPESAPKAFPGFVLFPQVERNGAWESGFDGGISDNNRMMIEIVEMLIDSLKIDPLRIYIHGLSNGAKGTWDAINRRPDLFAAALPMSGVGSADLMAENLAHMPIWLFQGGEDTNPNPQAANQMISALEAAGGTPRYTLYPELGHGVWNTAYDDDDFFPWMLRHSELSIHVYYSLSEFCPGEPVNAKLGISSGHYAYQWSRDGDIISGANSYNLMANELGAYRVRIITQAAHRAGESWSKWSDPVYITIKIPTTTPIIVASGSTTLGTNLDEATDVTLSVPGNYAAYQWSTGATSPSITVSNADSYTVTVTEEGGCPSAASAPLIVTKDAPVYLTAPSSLNAIAASPTRVNLFWEDNTDNEMGFEIYRSLDEDENYVFVTKTKANEVFFADKALVPGTLYYYQIRAVSNVGSSPYAGPESAETLLDNEEPSRPGNLVATANFDLESITLNWEPSTDNVGVTSYIIYQVDEANTLNSVGSTADTTFLVTELLERTSYTFVVKAEDGSGNFSQASNQASAATVFCGLKYTLYQGGTWNNVSEFENAQILATGHANNFDINIRSIYEVGNNNFAFEFEGRINIQTGGTYNFELTSDDGSVLWIDNSMLVNNDEPHGTVSVDEDITLAQGLHTIRVRYFENSGANENLSVKYTGPVGSGITEQLIPDDVLCSGNISSEIPPSAPSGLIAQTQSASQINLNWTDNSDDEYGFELYRGSSAEGPYTLIHTTVENATTYNDTGLEANTTYFYKLRAIGATGQSEFTDEASNLNYAYYEGTWDNLPNFDALTPVKTGKTTNFNISSRNQNDNFAFAFEGQIVIAEAGDYTFYTNSDDGSKLYIDNEEVVDNDGLHGNEEASGHINLSEGTHDIRVTYFEKGGGEVLGVQYEGPDITKQSIPDEVLNPGIVSATTFGDTEAPTIPQNLAKLNQTDEAVGLSWDSSTDNVRVTGYNIYHHFDDRPDTLLATTNRWGEIVSDEKDEAMESFTAHKFITFAPRKQRANGRMMLLSEAVEEPMKVSTQVTGLEDNTFYAVVVTATDAAGNESAPSNTISFKTNESIILPIVLVSFSAKSNKESVRLSWETATEINNEVFTIERSTNGTDFRAIGTIPGAGNSLSPHDYTFIDDYPEEGTLFYRLKQTDYNGDFTYSKIVSVRFANPMPFTLTVYPNPTASDNLYLKVNGATNNEMVWLKVVDIMGRIQLKSAYSAAALAKGLKIEFNRSLTPGIYLVLAEQAGEVYKTKVIIQ